ncbi:unnamed protein product [Gongylonema pulchrum]|uniref:IFT81_CH domain-containing protein n=1 Tax=Gongylonema pulchrum TaxID=637853 RepID=A0A183D9I4_9BILA|nr:unnamed protein product [Gongylonema pulchrum]
METVDINPDIIDEVWRSVTTRSLLELDEDSIRTLNPNIIDKLYSLLKQLSELSKFGDPSTLLERSSFSKSVHADIQNDASI